MTAVSKVSRRLTQAIAPEVLEHIYQPRLGAELIRSSSPTSHALNQAHLVMLARQGILKPADGPRHRRRPPAHRSGRSVGDHSRTPRLRTPTSTSRRDSSR